MNVFDFCRPSSERTAPPPSPTATPTVRVDVPPPHCSRMPEAALWREHHADVARVKRLAARMQHHIAAQEAPATASGR